MNPNESPDPKASRPPPPPAHAEEPEITQEESVPTDGRDVEGEEAMKKVKNDQMDDPKAPPTP